MTNWIKENFSIVSYVVALLFFIGGAYAEFQYLQAEIEHLQVELKEQELVIKELQDEVKSIHLFQEYHKGYIDANYE